MSLSTLQVEMGRIALNTRRGAGLSLVIHGLIFALLLLYQSSRPESTLVTEITWIEPAKPTAPLRTAPAVAKPRAEEAVPARQPREQEVRFRREAEVADLAPTPQADAPSDQLKEKLQQTPKLRIPQALQAASAPPTASLPAVAAVAAPEPQRGNTTLELKRDERSTAPALELKRSRSTPPPSTLVQVNAPAIDPHRALDRPAAGGGAQPGAGAMTGPAADRPLRSRVLPRYPDWAKREGVEASVSLYFIVLPDGGVKPNVLVEKTSGFDDFDHEARRALFAWRFSPLDGPNAEEQWGRITFNFRLTR
ncbi:MAG: TonB family protein [Candidatus Krumholzibacteriota bacterium]|nr:TonB family protein [Candidatus Krumholzibacteriota bacterium]